MKKLFEPPVTAKGIKRFTLINVIIFIFLLIVFFILHSTEKINCKLL